MKLIVINVDRSFFDQAPISATIGVFNDKGVKIMEYKVEADLIEGRVEKGDSLKLKKEEAV